MERVRLLREGRKKKGTDKNRPRVVPSRIVTPISASPLPDRESPLLSFHVAECWKRRLPYDRSALRGDENTWICATISIFVPSRKGYFCLNFEGLLKAGML